MLLNDKIKNNFRWDTCSKASKYELEVLWKISWIEKAKSITIKHKFKELVLIIFYNVKYRLYCEKKNN